MYQMRLRQLASAFLDAGSIKPTARDMAGLMDLLGSESGLVPAAVQEQLATGLVARIGFMTPDGQWQVTIGSTRIDVTRRPVSLAEMGLDDVEVYCQTASRWLAAILRYFNRSSHRLAFVQEGLLPALPQQELDSVAETLFGPKQDLLGVAPFEWDFRVASRVPRSFGESAETTNTIVTIKRINGMINLPTPDGIVAKELDRIRIDIDVNTSPLTTVERFGPDEVEAFFAEAPAWHHGLLEQVARRMGIAADTGTEASRD